MVAKMKKRLMLDGDWSLIYVANKTYRTEKPLVNTIADLERTSYDKVPARVPGNLERDLFRAGVIDDPYFGSNSIKYQYLEKMHMFYYRTFVLDEIMSEEIILNFEGIDTAAEIFLNGVKIGEAENMLIAHSFNITDDVRVGENEIIVHIIPACIAARKYPIDPGTRSGGYHAPGISMRKAPHMYGWDIMPRIVSGGIWKSVYIDQIAEDRIDDVYIYALSVDANKNTACLSVNFNSHLSEDDPKEYSLKFTGACGDSIIEEKVDYLWHTSATFTFNVSGVKLWWPHNYGEPNVYDFKVELLHLGKVVDEYHTRIGIRMAELDRTDMTDEKGSGEFVFRINGKKIFAMGTNWVPVDAIHSFDADRLPAILPMLDDIGCNIIRIWGGNVYENDMLYDYCDDHGIMVWQDFIMGCALYPQDEDFKRRLYIEAGAAVRRLRCHPSIVLWAGDNECDEAYFWGAKLPYALPSQNVLTREVLPAALRVNDQSRPYLPSSPYLSDEVVASGKRYFASENHLWGPRDYFKGQFYGNSICHFASETGYHGCNSPDGLARFISADQLWPWIDKEIPARGELWSRQNDLAKPDWLTHAACAMNDGSVGEKYRIPMMANQVITLFGQQPQDLNTFAYQSQISQAEAKKYFIERFRVSKWRRTGIIWWNLIDGWPQISDAVVDYYGYKKIAYHYIKRSQQPLCFIFDEPSDSKLPLYVVNDLQQDKKVRYSVTDVTTGEKLVESTITAKADSVTAVWNKDMIEGEKHFYIIEWEFDGVKGKNHYFTNIIDIDYESYKDAMQKVGFWEEFEGFGDEHPRRSKELPYVFKSDR